MNHPKSNSEPFNNIHNAVDAASVTLARVFKDRVVQTLTVAGYLLLASGCAHAGSQSKRYEGTDTAINFAKNLGMSPDEFNVKYEITVEESGDDWVLMIKERNGAKVEKKLPTLSASTANSDEEGANIESDPENSFTKLKGVIDKYLGIKYKHGGLGPEDGGFGPSGLTKRVFKETMGLELPRGAGSQSQAGGEKIQFENLKPGDLIFFGNRRGKITSVAIYMGGNQMVIADGSVKETDINSWFKSRFAYGKRVLDNPPEDSKQESTESTDLKTVEPRANAEPGLTEVLSEDELNGMPKATLEKWMGSLKKYEGIPWRSSKNGPFENGSSWPKSKFIDCSGTTVAFMYELSKITGSDELLLHATRSSKTLANLGTKISKSPGSNPFANLKVGDLMIFDTNNNKKIDISHVGVYIGGGEMRHVGTTSGIKTVDLMRSGGYYVRNYLFSRRIISGWKDGKPTVKK